MKRSSCIAGIALVTIFGVACNNAPQGRSRIAGQHGSAPGEGGGASGAAHPPSESAAPAANGADTRLSAAEQAFVQKATKGNEAEVDLAKMAQDKAQKNEVKDYARLLERDHSNAIDELHDIARKGNVTLDSTPPAEKASLTDKLNAARGAQFDREYVSMMIDDHHKDIAEFERMQGGATGELKAFIDKTLPAMREHLAKAEELMKGIGTK
jgi:putative membrane protein